MSDHLSTRLKQDAFVLVSVTELTVTLSAPNDGSSAESAADEAQLRIELFESRARPRQYRARLYRLSYFRMRPSFPQHEGTPLHESDERIWTEFDGCNCPLATAQSFTDAEAATDYVIAGLARWMNPPAPTR